jgi:hypothetical protein
MASLQRLALKVLCAAFWSRIFALWRTVSSARRNRPPTVEQIQYNAIM